MTGTNHDPDVDQLLSDSGAQWRASLPSNVDHYPELERRASRSRTLGLGGILGSLAGVLAVMIVAVLVVVSLPPHDRGIAGATPTPSRSSAMPLAWRLLGTARVDGGLDQAYNVRAATTGEQWQELWQAADHLNPPPTVDLSREILVSFTHGVGSSCPDLRLDDVVIDLQGRTIYSVVSNPLGNIACTADLVGGVVFVVAIDRTALPQSPFTVQLDAPATCAGLTCVAVDVDIAASTTPSPTPARPLSPDEAIARVVAFVDDAALTGDLTATGPTQGASMRYYDVTGTHLSASVDANTGAITTLLFTNMPTPGPSGPTRAEAVAIAKAFAVEHGISVEGMTMTVEKRDHGETWEWDVKWARYAGDVLLPDTLEVGVDPSGHVWRWVSFSRPYSSPPAPTIDQTTAEAAAIRAAFTDAPQSRVDSTQLTLKVDANGKQRLVWDVQVAAAHAQPSGPVLWNDYAWVEVDAETGVATVLARG